jgi:hypothetical protein
VKRFPTDPLLPAADETSLPTHAEDKIKQILDMFVSYQIKAGTFRDNLRLYFLSNSGPHDPLDRPA